MEIQKVVASNLAKARGTLSRQELAKLSGVTYQTIYDIEEGRRKPSLDVVESLAGALRMEPAELLKTSEPILYKPKVSDVLQRLASIPDEIYDLAMELNDIDDEVWRDIEKELKARIVERSIKQKA